MGTIIGICKRNGIISHIAILAKNVNDVKYGNRVPVYQMAPPLTSSLLPASPEIENDPNSWNGIETIGDMSADEISANVIAFLEDLSEDERRQMRLWFHLISPLFAETGRPSQGPKLRRAELADFITNCHYIAHPPICEKYDFTTGRPNNLWFSCAGFVIYLYEKSKVVRELLVSYSEPSFPTVNRDIIHATWFKLPPEIMSAIGLSGDGPWPVVMPGYVANAFKRESNVIRNTPYLPQEEDLRIA